MIAESRTDRQEIRRLVRIIAADPEQIVRLTPIELDLAIRVARRCRLLGQLGVNLDREGLLHELPQIAVDQIVGAVAMAGARSRLAAWELDRIDWAVGVDAMMPLIAMKGCAYVLLGLPGFAGRVFADVDIMTSERELPDLEAQLNRSGWQTQELSPYDDNYYRTWTHELPPLVHVEREMEIDLHHNILPRTARFHPDADALIKRARRLADSRFMVFADEDLVIHAIVHLFVDSDLADKLRDLVDVVNMTQHFAKDDAEFWDKLIGRAAELGLGRPVYYAIRYGKMLLGLKIPPAIEVEADRWAPNMLTLAVMDRAVDRALLPTHPDRHSELTVISKHLLYIRSHWLRMPPWLLAYHLTYKFFLTRLRRDRSELATPE